MPSYSDLETDFEDILFGADDGSTGDGNSPDFQLVDYLKRILDGRQRQSLERMPSQCSRYGFSWL